MKIAIGVLTALAVTVLLCGTAAVASAAELTVSPGGAAEPHCAFPLPHYPTIGAALAAAHAGDTIRVCPGVYNEQVVITKSVDILGPHPDPEAKLTDADDAVIMPTAAAQNTTLTSNPSMGAAAILLVQNVTGVKLKDLIVDGSGSGLAQCAPTFIGIYFQNASGEVNDSVVRNIELSSSAGGCQSGGGVVIESGNGLSSDVQVVASSIHDYQKVGVSASGDSTTATVQNSVVTGNGPLFNPALTIAAQNGVQIGDGAHGEIVGSTITNHGYTTCTSISACTVASADILILNSNRARISNNTLGDSNIAIYVQGNRAEIQGNVIFNSKTFDGIDLIGNSNVASGNTIVHSDESGVYIQGNDNEVTQNTIQDAASGVLSIAPSSGSDISQNNFIDTHIPVNDPATPPARTISPF